MTRRVLAISERRCTANGNTSGDRLCLSDPPHRPNPIELPFPHREQNMENQLAGIRAEILAVLNTDECAARLTNPFDRSHSIAKGPAEAVEPGDDDASGLAILDPFYRLKEHWPVASST